MEAQIQAHCKPECPRPHKAVGGKRAFTLIELLIAVAIIAILAAIAVPNFLEAQVRSKVSRCRADLRAIAIAVESYRLDHNRYPAFGQETNVRGAPGRTLVFGLSWKPTPSEWDYQWLYTHMTCDTSGAKYASVTTPIAYATQVPEDPFGPLPGGAYAYYHTQNHWAYMLCSFTLTGRFTINAGLDQDYDNELAGSRGYEYMLDPHGANPTERLVAGTVGAGYAMAGQAFTYDPTNGTRSHGCLWRVGP